MDSRTQIICTLGPASDSEDVIRGMAAAGMDVARINFSHGTLEEHAAQIETVRKVNQKHGFAVKILQDLEGHRIRTGLLKDHRPVMLTRRSTVKITTKHITGDEKSFSIDYTGAISDIKVGQSIFIDDGYIQLKVRSIEDSELTAEVIVPGRLGEQKGVNIPEAPLRFEGLTEKDREDIRFGIAHSVDFVAQSFVRDKGDVQLVSDAVKPALKDCHIVAKVENREGIRNIEGILEAADGLMVARGDLGVSLPIFEVPLVQKALIRTCRENGRFAIIATQMLESMTHNPRPTRAEVSDVANAILDGASFVMLSGETAVGDYPVETVRMMEDVIRFTEHSAKTLSRKELELLGGRR